MPSTSLTNQTPPMYTLSQVQQIVANAINQVLTSGSPMGSPANFDNEIALKDVLPSDKQVFSVSETAEILGISRPTVYKLVNSKKLPAAKAGTRVLIARVTLAEWIRNGGKHG